MRTFLVSLLTVFSFSFLLAQGNFWVDVAESEMVLPEDAEPSLIPLEYRTLSLDLTNLKDYLIKAPMEFTSEKELTLRLPLPDGTSPIFKIYESPIFPQGMAEKFPDIKTYSGYQIDKPAVTTRFDYGPNGFHAIIHAEGGTVMVDPYIFGQTQYYMSFRINKVPFEPIAPEYSCQVKHDDEDFHDYYLSDEQDGFANDRSAGNPVTLHRYRVGVATTAEFFLSHGGTVPTVLASVTTIINNVNSVMEKDIGNRLILVDDADKTLFDNPSTDGLTNGSPPALNSECPGILNNAYTQFGYDIGHAFGTNAGGLASLAGVCSNFIPGNENNFSKANASSSTFGAYSGSLFFIIVAHEMGHQFSATHNFNFCDSQNESLGTGFEPGSGSTIMCYAGASNCGSNYVQNVNEPYYHINAMNRIFNFSRDLGSGGLCAVKLATDNTTPTASIPTEGDFYIPILTPFELIGEASDDEDLSMLYNWEEYDASPILATLGSPEGTSPAFRSFPPSTNLNRVFPRIETILNNGFDKNEVLVDYSRDFTFRFSIRDCHPGAGGTDWAEIAFQTTDEAGPFLVQYPNDGTEEWQSGQLVEILWDVAGTDGDLVNCKAVNIKLSTDGGYNYPYVLSTYTANDGSQEVFVPNITSTEARIRVEAANNIFFDLSNFNHRIEPATEPGFIVNASSEFRSVCVPNDSDFNLEFYTDAILGYDESLSFEIVGGLPLNSTYEFSSDLVNPGETVMLNINMNDATEFGDFMVDVIAVGNGTDTAFMTLNFEVINNDFSSLKMLLPSNGATSLPLISEFEWVDMPNAYQYDIEIATSPTFESGTILDAAYGIQENIFTPDQGFIENELYYWRIRPYHEKCGVGEYLTPFAFHTFTSDCVDYESVDIPKNIPVQGTPTISSELIVLEDGIITDVNIRSLKGEHDVLADLEAHITSPAGTRVKLFGDLPCFVIPFNFNLDDEAAFDISCPPVGGLSYLPHESLSTFDGESTFGTWLLEVKVTTNLGNGGYVQGWGVQFCANTTPKSPFITVNDTLRVPDLDSRAIAPSKLKVEDEDNSNNELVYTIVEAPKNGVITLNGNPINVGDQFLQGQIDVYKVRYEHQVTGTLTDFFTFVVEDGTGGFVGVDRFNIIIDNNAPVNTDEAVLESSITLFPNPATDLLNIAIDQPIDEKVTLNIVDVTGRLLSQRQFNFIHDNIEINTSGFAGGIYFVNFQLTDTILTKRFVIQR